MGITTDHIRIDDDQAEQLAQAARLMSEALDRSRAPSIALRAAGMEPAAAIEVAPATLRLVARVLAVIGREKAVILYPQAAELTTNQAAEMLGVSRPFLTALLDRGEIAHRKVGRHRRVLMRDVLAHRERMKVQRRAALDELVAESQALGGYDL